MANFKPMHDRSISRREALTLAMAAAGTLLRPAARAELLFAAAQSDAQRVTEELRLIVPRWYGMASTKWLRHVHARATDTAGHRQPEQATPNPGGYGNNSIHRVRIDAR